METIPIGNVDCNGDYVSTFAGFKLYAKFRDRPQIGLSLIFVYNNFDRFADFSSSVIIFLPWNFRIFKIIKMFPPLLSYDINLIFSWVFVNAWRKTSLFETSRNISTYTKFCAIRRTLMKTFETNTTVCKNIQVASNEWKFFVEFERSD